MSPAPVARAGPGHVGDHRRRFVDRGSSANRDSGGADQLSPAVIARLLLVAGAIVLGALWIVLASLAPGHLRCSRSARSLRGASRLLLRALGVRLVQRAGPRSGPSLVVAHHLSWLDVLVLSASGPVLPVANAEVAGWPLIGALARRSGAIFLDPTRLSGLADEVEQIAAALRRGHRVLVFPADGAPCESGINPFRRAAFQAAVDAAAVVSPVAVTYRSSCGCATTLGAPVGGATPVGSLLQILAHRAAADLRWLPVIPAIVDGGHPARHRARAAASAERAITRALQQPPTGPTLPRTRPVERRLLRRRRSPSKPRTSHLRHGRRDLANPVHETGQATAMGRGRGQAIGC